MSDRDLLEAILKRLDGVETQLGGVRLEIGDMRLDIGGLRSDVDGLRSDVDGLRSDVDGLRSDVDGLRMECADNRREINGLHYNFAVLASTADSLSQNVLLLSQTTNLRFTALEERIDDRFSGLEARVGALEHKANKNGGDPLSD